MPQLVGELRNLNRFGKQAAIGVWEGLEVILEVAAALLLGRVQHVKQADEGIAQILSLISDKIVMKLVTRKHLGILGIEAEHDAHAQDIQPPESLGRVVVILGEQRVIQASHNLSSLHRDLHLAGDVFFIAIDQKHQPVVLLTQILEQDFFGLAIGLLHVIDKKRREIAGHNPAGMIRYRHVGHIALGLLERVEHGAVALLDSGP